jgi:hypothetical protein
VAGRLGSSSLDIATLKLDAATGATLWSAAFNGTAGQVEKGEAVAVDANGDVYVTGSSGELVGDTQWRVIKYDGATGAQLWTAQHGVANADSGLDALIDPAGDLVVGGYSYSSITGGDYRVIKYAAATGVELWNTTFSGLAPGGDQPTAIALDAAGNVFVTGDSYDGDVSPNRRNMRIVKLAAATGAILWSKTEDTGVGEDSAFGVAVDAAGDAFITGRVMLEVSGSPRGRMRTLKYRGTDGQRLWATDAAVEPGDGNSYSGSAVAVDAAGNVLAVGYHFGVEKYAGSDGTRLWARAAPPVAAPAVLSSLGRPAAIRDGRIALINSEWNDLDAHGQRLTFFDAASGQPIWSISPDVSHAVAIGPGGDVYVGGRHEFLSATLAYAARFSGATGALVWGVAPLEPSGTQTETLAIATLAGGDVVVAQAVCRRNFATCDNFVRVARLAAATGLSMWTTEVALATPGQMVGPLSVGNMDIRVDSQGDVVVGTLAFPSTMAVARVYKFSGATGSLLWTSGDVGQALARLELDSQGNAIVLAGTFDPSGSGARVAKFAAASGSTLWDVQAATGNYSMTQLVVLPGDDVVTFGQNGVDRSWRILRRSGTNGSLVWGRSLSGGSIAGDAACYGSAATVDANGNIVVAGCLGIAAERSSARAAAYHPSGKLLWTLDLTGTGQWKGVVLAALADGNGTYLGSNVTDVGAPVHVSLSKVLGGPAAPLAVAPSDLSGDGQSDLVLQDSEGRVAAWLMDGATPTASAALIGPGTGWTVTHTADLDGDGKADILFRHQDGRAYVYLMDGLTIAGGKELLPAGLGWSVSHTADLDGDGKADLILRHADGRAHIWLMNGTTIVGSASLLPAGSGWRVVGTGDFNVDGSSDIVFMHDDGRGYMYRMDGTVVIGGTAFLSPGSGWTVSHVIDFDGDRRADLVFRHENGAAHLFLMNGALFGAGLSILGPGTGWTVAHGGDLNGDGNADLVFSHTDGRAHVRLMSGITTVSAADILPAASGWSVTHLRDFNADQRSDLVFRHADGRITVRLMDGLAILGSANLIGPGGWSVAP